jgi:hypothetical protein
VAYWARRVSRWVVVLDGVEAGVYDGFVRGSRLVFNSLTSLHALALLGGEVLRLGIEISAPADPLTPA